MDTESHEHRPLGNLTAMAVSATPALRLRCAIGEILGLIIGTALGSRT